jgi:hypothetical protein
MNAPGLQKKLSADDGRVARLAKSGTSAAGIVDELYLLTYSRLPTNEEKIVAEALFLGPKSDRRSAVEDLLWALLNSAEFVFKD